MNMGVSLHVSPRAEASEEHSFVVVSLLPSNPVVEVPISKNISERIGLVGFSVGATVGLAVGSAVGSPVGFFVGAVVGTSVGFLVGSLVGFCVGETVGV